MRVIVGDDSPPRWRGTDPHKVLDPLREMIRNECPRGNEGFVAEDLDLILKYFGVNYGLDDYGRIRFIEVKHGEAILGYAQSKTFTLIDMLMRAGDEALVKAGVLSESCYDGFFIVGHDADAVHDESTTYTLYSFAKKQRVSMDFAGFVDWLNTPYS